MYPRLQLLKEMLRDDGAIFVSIDDNEMSHLRMLMDEVFGESNFLATICWQKVFAPKPFIANSNRVEECGRHEGLAWARRTFKIRGLGPHRSSSPNSLITANDNERIFPPKRSREKLTAACGRKF